MMFCRLSIFVGFHQDRIFLLESLYFVYFVSFLRLQVTTIFSPNLWKENPLYGLKLEDYLLQEPNGKAFILLKRPRLYARLVPDFQIFFSICLLILSFQGLVAISFYLHASFPFFAPRIQSLLSGCPMNSFLSTFHLGFSLILFRLLFEFHILRAFFFLLFFLFFFPVFSPSSPFLDF